VGAWGLRRSEMGNIDWCGVIFFIGMFMLIILCVGDPDILDGLIKMANK
jgi:hypothetical protein